MFDSTTKILVVDDMLTMRKIVSRCLKDFGYSHIAEAADGEAAWNLMQSEPAGFGLVISDWNMPNCSGLDLLKRVRSDQRIKMTPFILVTAESEASQVSQALAAKVDGYIVKPFNAEILKNKIGDVHKKVSGRAAA